MRCRAALMGGTLHNCVNVATKPIAWSCNQDGLTAERQRSSMDVRNLLQGDARCASWHAEGRVLDKRARSHRPSFQPRSELASPTPQPRQARWRSRIAERGAAVASF